MKNNHPQFRLGRSPRGGRYFNKITSMVVMAVVGLSATAVVAAPTSGAVSAHKVKAKPKKSTPPDPARLKSILQGAPGPFVAYGTVLDLDTGSVIFDLHGNQGLTPASVSKLYATSAAAHALSFSERLTTRVVATPIRGGSVKQLFIIGGGDPSLSKGTLGSLADKVVAAGLKRIKHLVVDTSLFDNRLPRGFNEKITDASYRAPIDALNLDRGTIVISVERGAAVGAKPVVVISPPSAAIVIDNTAKMVAGKRRGISVGTKDGPKNTTVVVVRGVMGMKRKRIVAGRRRVNNAAFHAGHAFARMLRDRGAKVGKVSFGRLPSKAAKPAFTELASHRSKPVFDLMSFCNKFSHNGYAETFFKLAGQRIKGTPGTCAKGEAAVRQTLSGAGIDWSTVRLGNGSGLYHANRVTTLATVRLLQAMAKTGKKGQLWRRTLAIGGVDGTLRRRLHGRATRGKIFAKTGTLNDVTALAGYAINKADGRRYAFALFYNKVKRPAYLYRRVHDKFLVALLDPSGKLTPKPKPKAKKAKRRVRKKAKRKKRTSHRRKKATKKRRKR